MTIVNKDTLQEMKARLSAERSEEIEVVPGCTVRVRELSAEGAMDVVAQADEGVKNWSFVWVSHCCVDSEGGRVWTEEETKQLPATLHRNLWESVCRVNPLLSTKAVEEAEKNSEKAES